MRQKAKKERLDAILVRRGFFETGNRAQAAVMEGIVFVDGVKVEKPGTKFADCVEIEVRGSDLPYVSRGGLKLKRAVDLFGVSLLDKVVLDIGASTGGFTDCALQNGAKKVYAVDVGYGQLAWKLRQDKRVVSMERTNARYLSPEEVGQKVDVVVIDVSFISLRKLFPAAAELLLNNGELIALVKPQFEAGREHVGKKGVVRKPDIHVMVIERVIKEAETFGFYVRGLTYSDIKGPEGNIEYLLYLQKNGEDGEDGEDRDSYPNIRRVVNEAQSETV